MPSARHHALYYADLTIRIAAGVALIPLAIATVFLAIMAGDSPRSGPIPSIIVLAIGACLLLVLWQSCAHPDRVAKKLEPYLGWFATWVVRAPAYFYAPFGLYYGSRFVAGILKNLL